MQHFPEWSELLSLDGPWAELVVSPERDVDTFVASALNHAPRALVRIIRGQRCPTADRLFQEFAAALQFPYYFGHNWDALDECLNDLEWLPASAYVLVVTRMERLLTSSGNEYYVFMRMVERTASEWAKPVYTSEFRRPAVAFRVLFHCQPEDETAARQRLRDAGIAVQ